jgi:hypothetical protein
MAVRISTRQTKTAGLGWSYGSGDEITAAALVAFACISELSATHLANRARPPPVAKPESFWRLALFFLNFRSQQNSSAQNP